MPGGYRLNPYEQGILGLIQSSADDPGAGDYGSMLLGLVQSTVGGAQDRRQQNIATREAGIQALQQQAMQLAATGATEDALSGALLGQAGELPGMRGARGVAELAGLDSYIGSLYDPTSPVSGLAPPDYRSQFSAGGLDETMRQAIGTAVQTDMDDPAGKSLESILAGINEDTIALGMDPAEAQAAMDYAQEVYYRLAGLSSEQMSGITSGLEGADDLGWIAARLDLAGSPQLAAQITALRDAEDPTTADYQSIVDWAAGDQVRLGNLYEVLQQAQSQGLENEATRGWGIEDVFSFRPPTPPG